MSTHRRRRIDRGTAERLLRGAASGDHAGNDPLFDLLAAVAAPSDTRLAERVLPGEDDAVDAFQEARLTKAIAPPKKSIAKVAIASLLTWKAFAAAGITASAIGGAAIIGGGNPETDSPAPSRDTPAVTRTSDQSLRSRGFTAQPKESSAPDPATARSVPGGPLPDRSPAAPHPTLESGSPSVAASRDAASAAASSSPSPSPSLEGLCRAYRAQGEEFLQNPALDQLVDVAGGRSGVAAYCDHLLGANTNVRDPKKLPSTPTAESSTTGNSPADPGPESVTAPPGKPLPPRSRASSDPLSP